MRNYKLPLLAAAVFCFFFVNEIFTNTGGPSAGVTGAPTDQTCAKSGCHSGTVNSGPGVTTISSTVPISGYVGGNTYGVTVSIEEPGRSKFGFQAMAAYSAGVNKQVGSAIITDASATQIRTNFNGQYVTHRSGGTAGNDARTWSFNWTAPNQGAGDVEIFAAFNASNSQGNTTGDNIYTKSLQIIEQPVGVDEQLAISFSQVYPTIFNDYLRLEGHLQSGNELEVSVVDLTGTQIYSLVDPIYSNSFTEQIATQNWGSGIYFVQVRDGKRVNDFKVIKQ